MKILVIGSNGQLGKCLIDQFKFTDFNTFYTSRSDIDISDFYASNKIIKEIQPNIIINAAAYTAVDKAEIEKEKAYLLNKDAVKNLSNICSDINCWLIHISTDYVFDGKSNIPYTENDSVNPQSTYGSSKLAGEIAIKESGCKYVIIRTSWVFSNYGVNFMNTMLKLAKTNDNIEIVNDQFGCPTYGHDLAKAIISIISVINKNTLLSGTYNFCGDKLCSWFEFANTIFSELSFMSKKIPPSIRATPSTNYKTLAVRPAYSALDCSKINKYFGISTSNWKEGIKDAIIKNS